MENGRAWTASRTLFVFLLSGIIVAGSHMMHASTRWSTQHTDFDANISAEAPLCGRLNDEQVHIPPHWNSFTPPAVEKSYIDPVFGCAVERLTDTQTEGELPGGKHVSFMNYYSTVSPINTTDTKILVYSNDGAWRIKDTNGKLVVPSGKMPTMNNGHPVWDATDGDVFYYALGKSLHKATIKGNAIKNALLNTFKEYRGIVSPDAADLSQDGDHLALVGQNDDNTMDVFVWSLKKKAKTSVYTTTCKVKGDITETTQPGCVHKLLLSADNLLSLGFAEEGTGAEQGVRLWNGSSLIHLQDTVTSHYDHGYDLQGNPIFTGRDNSSSLAGIGNPCPSRWGLDVRQQSNVGAATCLLDKQPSWHVSYRGSESQPWVALSFFDDRKPGPELFGDNKGFQELSSSNWQLFEDEIVLVRVDGKMIYRLAHARSRSAESYWAQPHAAISRDGKYVVFTSNMAYPNGCPANMHVANECSDVYLIHVR